MTDEKCGGHNWAEVFARRARVEGVAEEVKKSSRKQKKTTKTVVKEVDEVQACVVCMAGQRRWVVQPCGHGIYCLDCYATHEAEESKKARRLKACPLCRMDVAGWIKVFL